MKGGINREMQKQSLVPKSKKGGVVTSTVTGVGGLIIGVVIILVVVSTLLNANLFGTTASTENDTAQSMSDNFTVGINNISAKIPTILLIVAVVFLFGALVLLIRNANLMGVGGGSSL